MMLGVRSVDRSSKPIVVGLALFCCLAAATHAQSQSRYTETQLKLAGQIGSVIGLVERCGIAPMPNAAFLRAMKAEGLREADMKADTAFKARVIDQMKTMKVMDGVAAQAGVPHAERRKGACAKLADMYGPEGYVRPGLAAPR
ncbi:hypothetical protein ABE438_09365 [Bosea sp. TWI1241]|uniref:hypothetical protein n=1 Tax=Bosea sp. TWI1241 TaxID=3148904 RepID=UPI003208683E